MTMEPQWPISSAQTTFADLHDRAGRMKAKGVIRESISWWGSLGWLGLEPEVSGRVKGHGWKKYEKIISDHIYECFFGLFTTFRTWPSSFEASSVFFLILGFSEWNSGESNILGIQPLWFHRFLWGTSDGLVENWLMGQMMVLIGALCICSFGIGGI